MKQRDEIEILIRARYPIILIESYEEGRVEKIVADIAQKREKRLICWSITRGLYPYGQSLESRKIDQRSCDPLIALDTIIENVQPTIFLFKDIHAYLGQAAIVRKLRELAHYLKNSLKTLILLSPQLRIPMELEKDVALVSLDIPDIGELSELLQHILGEVNAKKDLNLCLDEESREKLVKSAQGLTLDEAENVFAKALVMGGKLSVADIPVILSEKEQIIKKSGMLEYISYSEEFGHIGGLASLKDWLRKRSLAFTEKAKDFGLPAPKGVLMIGVQGCGKSLCAKALASLWQVPLLRLDLGKVFASLVGSSEENIRKAIRVAESVAPAILWIDEIEKAFAGTQSSAFSDAGTSARVFGSFLTWLQEKTAPVFVVATANQIRMLPAELLRKGRFDEIFFVDLPGPDEREEIFKIHLTKRRRDSTTFNLKQLASISEGFSGAEIAEAVVAALFDVFERGENLQTADIEAAINATVPLSRTVAEEIESLRRWAQNRARPASKPLSAPVLALDRRFLEIESS
jgi:SpoVK/Ycf46/Vps4 family AAA+-type ATPase